MYQYFFSNLQYTSPTTLFSYPVLYSSKNRFAFSDSRPYILRGRVKSYKSMRTTNFPNRRKVVRVTVIEFNRKGLITKTIAIGPTKIFRKILELKSGLR